MKRKKATAGEINGARVARAICRKCASCKLCVEGERSLVRAIARERRKERAAIVADLVSCWNCQSNTETREFLGYIIDRVREGAKQT